MKIAWTTTETAHQAGFLSKAVINARLAACAQISGPITSVYCWKGQTMESTEYRITFKLPDQKLDALRTFVLANHPYDTPQWVAADLTDVSEGYQSWADG